MSLMEQIDMDQFREVIAYSQDIENPKVSEVLKRWAVAKKAIADEFLEGKISYTYPEKVRFELNANAKQDKLSAFIEYVGNLMDNWRHPLLVFLDHINAEEFYGNSLERNYVIEEKDNKKILKGTKVIKAFKYFIEDPILLHDLQNKASVIIQENKVEGYLTFSVHPLDFLSSSENTHNWRSCHALDGEYRAGNLSYMCDSGTMMVFLASEQEAQLPHFPPSVPWNSKKWRMLLHFDNQLAVCFAGRQYPFFTPGALEVIKDIFSNHMAHMEYCGWLSMENKRQVWNGWYDDYAETFKRDKGEDENIEENRYCCINHGLFDRYNIIKDAQNSRHFNDLLRSSCYDKPYYMFKEFYGPQNRIDIEIGAEVTCLRCGEASIDSGDTMMCTECECKYGNSNSDEYKICDCCGTRFYWNEGDWVGDEYVCNHCIETETFVCQDCGERYYNCERHWNEETSTYLCDSCYNERNED